MSDGSDRFSAASTRQPPAARSSDRDPSALSDLVAWVLVGVSFGQLGVAVVDASTATLPISRTGALLVVGAGAVLGALAVGDFRPSIPAGAAYFCLESLFAVSFVLTGRWLGFWGSTQSPWATVAVRALAIALALLFVFSTLCRRSRRAVLRRASNFVKTAPR